MKSSFAKVTGKLKGSGINKAQQAHGDGDDDHVRLTSVEATSRDLGDQEAGRGGQPSSSTTQDEHAALQPSRFKKIHEFPRFVIRCVSSGLALLALIFLISHGKNKMDDYPGIIILQALINAVLLCFPLLMAWCHCKIKKKGARWVYKREIILDGLSAAGLIVILWVTVQGSDCRATFSTCSFLWPTVINVLTMLSLLLTLGLDTRAWYYSPPSRAQATATRSSAR